MNKTRFRKELEGIINENSMENGSNTPDFMLAEFLVGQLELFDQMVLKREAWYGIHSSPGNIDEIRGTM